MFQKLFRQGLHPLEVDVAQTVDSLKDGTTQVVDCREPEEWQAAHIAGTTLIPLDALEMRMNELDPKRPVIVVCRSGSRSLVAAQQLNARGFANAKSLAGGLIAWVEEGHPVVQ